jgi:hypothetical protein
MGNQGNCTFLSIVSDLPKLIRLREQHYEQLEILYLEREIAAAIPAVKSFKEWMFWCIAPWTYILGFMIGMIFWLPVFAASSILTLVLVAGSHLYLYVKKRNFLQRLSVWETRSKKERFDLRQQVINSYSL